MTIALRKTAWVTRKRRADTPQLPHPNGYDEYVDGKLTGRISEIIGDRKHVGTIEELDRMEPAQSSAPEPDVTLPEAVVEKLFHSGLKRDLRFEVKMRRALDRFEAGETLTQIEFRHLLLFYGILVMATDVLGMPYWLAAQDFNAKHKKLVDMAADQGFTQSLLNVYGVMVREVFERFC